MALKITVTADADQFDREMRRTQQIAEKTAGKVKTDLGGMDSASSGGLFGRMSEGARSFGSTSLSAIGSVTNGLSSMLPGVGGVADGFLSAGTAGMGAMGAVGLAAGGAVTAIVGVGAALYKLGQEWDDYQDSLAIKTGATADEIAGMQQVAENVTSKWAVSMEDLGGIQAVYRSRLGETAAENEHLAATTANLARLTGEDMTQAATGAADVFQRWNVATGDQASTLDMFFVASQESGKSVTDLEGAVATAAATMGPFGYSLKETTDVMAAAAKTGSDLTVVTGGLNKMMVKLESAQAAEAQTAKASARADEQQAAAKLARSKAIKTATEGVDRAQAGLSKAQAEYQKWLSSGKERAVADARRQLASATKAVDDAVRGVTAAEKDLQIAMRGPQESDLADARLAVAEANDRVSSSLVENVDAQRALVEAQTAGNIDDIPALQARLAASQTAVTRSKSDAAKAEQKLTDLQQWSASKAPEVLAAQAQLKSAQDQVAEATQRRVDTEQSLQDRLGVAMDGAPQQLEFQAKIRDAQAAVADAQGKVADASQRTASANTDVATSMEEQSKLGPTATKVLSDLGLSHASAAEQAKGLNDWLMKNAASQDGERLAFELFGKGAPQILQTYKSIGGVIDEVAAKTANSSGKIDETAGATDDAAERMAVAWNRFKAAFAPVGEWFMGVLAGALDWMSKLPEKAENVVIRMVGTFITLPDLMSRVWRDVKSAATWGINSIIDKVNSLSDLWNNSMGSFAAELGLDINIPHIPHISLAKGGIVTGPTLAMIGDNPARREAVIPLPERGDLLGGGNSGGDVTVIINTLTGDAAAMKRAVLDAIAQAKREGSWAA